VIVDNLSNSSIDALNQIHDHHTMNEKNTVTFMEMDLRKKHELDMIFSNYQPQIVIHLAGWKAVNESIQHPMMYYQNNLITTMNLIEVMEKYDCKKLIFSSSATVYGNSKAPYHESSPTGMGLSNPYGKTKYMQEEMLKDLSKSDPQWKIMILRYFNPISQKNFSLREKPNGTPNNLFPYLVKIYYGELNHLNVFGNDYDTLDGTCIRDFIHVVDLAKGHVKSCEYLMNQPDSGCKIYNLGRGKGVSVKELIHHFEKVNQISIDYQYVERRKGDMDISYADVSLAEKELGWRAEYDLNEMVKMDS